jgi:hypothetical protein
LNVLQHFEQAQRNNPRVAAADAQRYSALRSAARFWGVNFPREGRVLHFHDAGRALAD